MKVSASFINIGRGNNIDEVALSETLLQGGISFSALDVLENELLPSDHFLWNIPNLLITLHISGMTVHFQKLFMHIF